MNDANKPDIKAKADARAKRIKFIVLMTTTMASLFALAVGSFAWFLEVGSRSNISAVAGDMDVEIDKVTAYKYIYPYIAKSAEFIDYKADPTLKGYVVQDSSVTFDAGTISSTTTISLGTPVTVTPAQGAQPGARNITCPAAPDFRYYLVGDATFNAVSGNPWSTQNGAFFAQDQNVVGNVTAKTFNVVISEGSKFTLFDKNNRGSGTTCTYLSYGEVKGYISGVEQGDAPFEVIDNGAAIRCLKSGIYDVEYSASSISISKSRQDDALIGNNMVDPTNIILEYEASNPKPPRLRDYVSTGILNQNTMVIFDIELIYTNKANPIDAGLKILRGSSSSISQLNNKYEDITNHTTGYQVINNVVYRNALTASDFYSFYALFTQEANRFVDIPAQGNVPAKSAAEALWDALHQKTDSTGFRSFSVDPYESSITYALNLKETSGQNVDSTIVPPSVNGNKYHCYIAVDYDYSHTQFFLNEDRLGKTYFLDRDFGFYFTSTQHLESDGA